MQKRFQEANSTICLSDNCRTVLIYPTVSIQCRLFVKDRRVPHLNLLGRVRFAWTSFSFEFASASYIHLGESPVFKIDVLAVLKVPMEPKRMVYPWHDNINLEIIVMSLFIMKSLYSMNCRISEKKFAINVMRLNWNIDNLRKQEKMRNLIINLNTQLFVFERELVRYIE